jgi:hypothetical protein
MVNNNKTLIYIASLVRSGSTLLDHLIGSEDTVTVGELARLNRDITMQTSTASRWANHVCRCEQPLDACPFWTKIRDCYGQRKDVRISEAKTSIETGVKSPIADTLISLLVYVLPNRFKRKVIDFFYYDAEDKLILDNYFGILDCVCDVTGKQVVIDSSKGPNQLYGLINARNPEYHLRVIHLVRGVQAFCFSTRTRKREQGRDVGIVRATLVWIKGHIKIMNLRSFFQDDDFLLIRYEDLCANPERVMRKLCDKFHLTFDASMLDPSEEGKHNIGGSPHRFTSYTKIRLDERWKTSMKRRDKFLCGLLGGLLNRKLRS